MSLGHSFSDQASANDCLLNKVILTLVAVSIIRCYTSTILLQRIYSLLAAAAGKTSSQDV